MFNLDSALGKSRKPPHSHFPGTCDPLTVTASFVDQYAGMFRERRLLVSFFTFFLSFILKSLSHILQ